MGVCRDEKYGYNTIFGSLLGAVVGDFLNKIVFHLQEGGMRCLSSGMQRAAFFRLLCIAVEAKSTPFSQSFQYSARDSIRVAIYTTAGPLSQLYFLSLIFF